MKNPIFGNGAAAAIERVAELEAERQTKLAEFWGLLGYLDSYRASSLSAQQKFVTDLSRQSLDEWMVAESLTTALPEAQKLLSGLASDNYVDRLFRNNHPERRELLREACQYKLKQAQGNFEEVRAKERKRLGENFDSGEIDSSPEVRRASSKVSQLDRLLVNINQDDDDKVWRSAGALLQT
jgi:hypothetical protein